MLPAESACSDAKRKLELTISAFDPLYASTSTISPSPPWLPLSTPPPLPIQKPSHTMSIRASSSGNAPMGPPADRDVVMAPPQFNPQQYPPPPNQPASVQQKPPQEYIEKYKRLKRKYFELEEVRVCSGPQTVAFPSKPPVFSHPLTPGRDACLLQKFKETETELLRSGERTSRMRHERRSAPLHIPFLTLRPLISLAVSSRHRPDTQCPPRSHHRT